MMKRSCMFLYDWVQNIRDNKLHDVERDTATVECATFLESSKS